MRFLGEGQKTDFTRFILVRKMGSRSIVLHPTSYCPANVTSSIAQTLFEGLTGVNRIKFDQSYLT